MATKMNKTAMLIALLALFISGNASAKGWTVCAKEVCFNIRVTY